MPVIVVPIKLNSRRLANKSIRELANKPLCFHVLQELLKLSLPVYVFCSSPSIKQYIPEDVIYLARDPELDGDSVSMVDVCQSFAKEVPSDVYVLSHATSPFLQAGTVKKGLKCIEEGHDSAHTVLRIQTFCWYNGQPINYSFDHVPRTQDLTPIFVETSGCYIFTKEVLDTGRRIGYNPFLLEVGNIEAIDIDTLEDLQFAQKLLNA